MPFSQLGLPISIINLLDYHRFEKPFPIQEQIIPKVIAGKDVLGIAKTGSGKTASYVLPLLTNLQQSKKKENRHVSVLVLVPTRELASQVDQVFKTFGPGLPKRIKSLAVYGGVSINTQMQSLQGVDVLIATPGRLIELVEKNAVSLKSIDALVLDEADKMLNQGFKEELNAILSKLPTKRQNLLFSATLSEELADINRLVLNEPEVVKIEAKESDVSEIVQKAFLIDAKKKGPLLRKIIKDNQYDQLLVFVASGYQADHVADKLRKNGIEAKAIHGKKSQGARTETLILFKSKRIQVLVATDLLGRGVDIQGLPCVINYELPRSPKDYIHRIGRTGRAGLTGEAISFVAPEDEHHFKVIQKKMKRWVDQVDGEAFLSAETQ